MPCAAFVLENASAPFIICAMKRILILGAILAMQAAAQAVDTAYTALRVYGKKEGEKALYRVIELRGSNGSPQPSTWKLVVDAPDARGGIREIDVQGGRIVGQRTPVSRDVGQAMNFTQLNLDSDGAFTVVNQEAGKRHVAFDRLDYTLRGGSKGGVPIWEVELYDKGNKVGTVRIAADSGELLEQNFSPQRRYAEDRTYVEGDRTPPSSPTGEPSYRDDGSVRDRPRGATSPTIPAFFDRVGRHFERRGKQIENFFTGKEGSKGDR
jgi:hypothetical protein